MNRTITLFITTLCLAACSSKPNQPDTFYLLDTPAPDYAIADDTQPVKVATIELARYLDQQFLVMEPKPQQIQFARFHRWADDPAATWRRALINSLNKSTYDKQAPRNLHFVTQCQQCPVLSVSLEHMYPSYSGELIMSGSYQLTMPDKTTSPVRRFSFKEALKQDGYSAYVSQCRELIQTLGVRIYSNLAKELSLTTHK